MSWSDGSLFSIYPPPLQAYELSTLTGTQVLLLVASETGHVYTFATRKLQPMITSETGKALIQTCLNSPDSPPRSDPSMDQRMSATGFEETDLTYQVSESESMGDTKVKTKPLIRYLCFSLCLLSVGEMNYSLEQQIKRSRE